MSAPASSNPHSASTSETLLEVTFPSAVMVPVPLLLTGAAAIIHPAKPVEITPMDPSREMPATAIFLFFMLFPFIDKSCVRVVSSSIGMKKIRVHARTIVLRKRQKSAKEK